MNQQAHHAEVPVAPFTATIRGEDGADAGRGNSGPRPGIVHNLEVVRSYLDEAIGACDDLEARGDLIEIDDRWCTPRRMTVVDSLQRLRALLDRIERRLQTTHFPRETPVASARQHQIDLAMAEAAARLARRFEEPDTRHDLEADVEGDLRELERLLDARIPRIGPGDGDATRPTARGGAEGQASGRSLRCIVDEYFDVFRRVDRHIDDARGDAPLQGFWRGVAQSYREEADRLGRTVGEARVARPIFEA